MEIIDTQKPQGHIIVNVKALLKQQKESHDRIIPVLLSLIVFVTSCYDFSGGTTTTDVLLVTDVEKTVPLDTARERFAHLHNARAVHKFYRSRNFQPTWWLNNIPAPQTDSLLKFIENVRTYGLLPQHYHLHELRKVLSDSAFDDQRVIHHVDLLLSDAFISIAKDLKHGRRSMILPDSLYDHGADSSAIAVLRAAFDKNELTSSLNNLEPSNEQYVHLRNELRRLISASKPDVRLQILSGVISDTFKVYDTLARLEINLQRWREERLTAGKFILVNIPGYQLEVFDGDSIVFQSKVIVGTKRSPTPMLDGLLRSFMIFPYWNVPRSIAVNEILPQVKKDSLYLSNHHYEIIGTDEMVVDPSTVPWAELGKNNFPYTIRQTEGVHNALGLVKFWFHNPYDVYLHDTNARYLFGKPNRALSHGCVRVEKAMELARHLLEGNDVVSPEDLDQYVEMQKQSRIKVDEPIEVRFRYFTAAYKNGVVEYYDDIYEEDENYLQLLYGPTLQGPVLISARANAPVQ